MSALLVVDPAELPWLRKDAAVGVATFGSDADAAH